MQIFPFEISPSKLPKIGMVILQADGRLETDLRTLLPAAQYEVFVSRIPSGAEVSQESLLSMQDDLVNAASLLPPFYHYDVIGYGCTSASAVIGPDKVAQLIRQGPNTSHITNPLSALVASCRKRNIKRLAVLSPYVEVVNESLFSALKNEDIAVSDFASFNEPTEARVAEISSDSIKNAALELGKKTDADAVFLSCTNLNTLDILNTVSNEIGKPVLSSNSVLIEHLVELCKS